MTHHLLFGVDTYKSAVVSTEDFIAGLQETENHQILRG